MVENEEKIGLLQQFLIAAAKPAEYGKILCNRLTNKVIYIIVLMLFLVFVEKGIPFIAWDYNIGGLSELLTNRVPAFEVTSKGLSIEQAVEITKEHYFQVLIDDGKKKYTEKDFNEDYPIQVLVSESNLLLKSANLIQQYDFSAIKEGTINNDTLIAMLPTIRLCLAVYIGIYYVNKLLSYLLLCVGYGLLCRGIVRTPEGGTVTLRESINIAFYAKTLCAIINSVIVCLGYQEGASVYYSILSIIITMYIISKVEYELLKKPS